MFSTVQKLNQFEQNNLCSIFRHGHIQSVNIDEQHFASITFSDIHTATKAHNAENILDQQKLRTAYYDVSNLISKILLKPTTTTDKDRDKCIDYSPEENTRLVAIYILRLKIGIYFIK
jgi:hypothetical protein